jgi:hypothetical protein
LFFVKCYAPISIISLNAAPAAGVEKENVPDPSVVNTCPYAPSAAGSVQILFVVTVPGALKPT